MNSPVKSLSSDTGEALRILAATALDTARMQINRTYLSDLGSYEVANLMPENPLLNAAGDVRLFRICRLVHENHQSFLESLTSAYTALGTSGYAMILYLDSNGEKTDVYIGTRGAPTRIEGMSAGSLLKEVFRGHFAGSAIEPLSGDAVADVLRNLASVQSSTNGHVSAVTGVPSLASDDMENFSQGLERFLDAAEGRRYRALMLAEPLKSNQLEEIRSGYEQMATQLSPLQKMVWSYGDQDSYSVGTTLSRSLGHTLGRTLGVTDTVGTTDTEGSSRTITTGTNSSTQQSTLTSKIAAGVGAAATVGGMFASASAVAAAGAATVATGGLAIPAVLAIGGAVNQIFGGTKSEGTSSSDAIGTSRSTSKSTSRSNSDSQTSSLSETVSDGRSDTTTNGSSRQLSVEFNDKGIEQLLGRIDQHLTRLEEARTYGGWTASAYFIAESKAESEALSSIFLGLIRGKNSNQQDFSVTTWSGEPRTRVLSWLGQLTHPVLSRAHPGHDALHITTPTTLLSTREVALQLSLPTRSTSTVSVVETQAFGRRIQNIDGDKVPAPDTQLIRLGQIRHLWDNLKQVVSLDKNQLCRHMFICGSTGSGKSNTIYNLLHEIHTSGTPFLVIEPAKGEYKNVVGHWDGVRVLGTNPKHTEQLRINPFAFPDGIHVLEHVDRLVEIFNVCWPMYAAMPAVLKDAILYTYTECGWDLDSSINHRHPGEFPGFTDLQESLQVVISSSDYAAEAKSNYLGALGTRVRSLCNGLNARLFDINELSDSELFDASVVVDLSRIGSGETRALVMGMLVMRLSEHRMSTGGMNQALRHITVLEEAHNLLPSSVSGGPEGTGMAGKSVEMLSSAIAEMRTYGEGFVIADQSPHAVDISAIRNTNIKIVMRLPEEADRTLIGGSLGLTELQIGELARLPSGVAVIHQNDWLEPVLCQINNYAGDIKPYIQSPHKLKTFNLVTWRSEVANLLLGKRTAHTPRVDLPLVRQGLEVAPLSSHSRHAIRTVLDARLFGKPMLGDNGRDFDELAKLLVDAWGCRRELTSAGQRITDVRDARERINRLIRSITPDVSSHVILDAEHCLIRDLFSNNVLNKQLYAEWHHHMSGEFA